jgi:hypothetical protein
MTIRIIVSRYNENIEWTTQLPNVLLYNKGTELSGKYRVVHSEHLNGDGEVSYRYVYAHYDSIEVIPYKNVGREGHTYYRYIYDHYDNLEDYTVFLQGDPFDHSPNIISDLHKYINNKDLNIDFEYLTPDLIDFNISGDIYHPDIPLIECYEKMFGVKEETLDMQYSRGAQFIVSKNQILKRPKEFYHKIVQMLDYHFDPIEGYVIERFHKAIFSIPNIIKPTSELSSSASALSISITKLKTAIISLDDSISSKLDLSGASATIRSMTEAIDSMANWLHDVIGATKGFQP